MNRHEALSVARRYKQTVEAAGIPFTSMILFGSAARDQMREQSDIDIAVIGTPFGHDRFTEMHELWRLRRPVNFRIQPIWFYPEHLNDKYSTLAQEIKRDGVLI